MKSHDYICQYCNRSFKRCGGHKYKYCSLKCSGHINGLHNNGNKKAKLIKHVCKNLSCKKLFYVKLSKKRKYCSNKCRFLIASKLGGKNCQPILRKLKISAFYDPNLRFKISSKGGKIGGYLGAKNSHKVAKRNKTGFWNSNLQRELGRRGGKVGGPKAIKILRKKYINTRPKYRNVIFDSKQEMNVCKKLMQKYSSFHPIQNVTVHKTVGHKEFDFSVRNTFIDYHPFDLKKTLLEYYKERRKVLNINGFRNFNYIVIKNINDMYNMNLKMEGVI